MLTPGALIPNSIFFFPHGKWNKIKSLAFIEHPNTFFPEKLYIIIEIWLHTKHNIQFSSVHVNHSVMSDSLQLLGLQHAGLPVHYQLPEFTQTHELVMPSNYLILCRPPLLLLSILPSIRVFSNESVLRIRWTKYWSFSFSLSPSNEYQDWLSLGWTDWISLQSKGFSIVFFSTTVQKHQFFGSQLSL